MIAFTMGSDDAALLASVLVAPLYTLNQSPPRSAASALPPALVTSSVLLGAGIRAV